MPEGGQSASKTDEPVEITVGAFDPRWFLIGKNVCSNVPQSYQRWLYRARNYFLFALVAQLDEQSPLKTKGAGSMPVKRTISPSANW